MNKAKGWDVVAYFRPKVGDRPTKIAKPGIAVENCASQIREGQEMELHYKREREASLAI